MGLFRRRRKDTEDAPGTDEAGAAAPDPDGPEDGLDDDLDASDEPGTGPWDVDEVPDVGDRIDLGAVRVPKRPGMQIRMELDKKTRRVVAVNVVLEGSALQVQAFAAPRSEGLWDELREEIAAQVVKQGGSADQRTGPFGREILARLPVRLPDGRSGHRPARFIGADGPRWFLRGVFSGEAAKSAEAAATLEDVFADIVVVRGTDARPPRDLLPLHLPGKRPEPVADATGQTGLELPRRGPEITEVR